MTDTDQELVTRLLRRERQAFDGFFSEYYPKLYRFAKRRAPHDPAGAEDVAQATLCRALASLRSFRDVEGHARSPVITSVPAWMGSDACSELAPMRGIPASTITSK